MVSNNRVRKRLSIIVLIISCAVLSWVGHHYVTKNPKGSVELNNISFSPKVGSKVKVGDFIDFSFDYHFKKGVEGRIWVYGAGLPVQYSSSGIMSGSGSAVRRFSSTKKGKTHSVKVVITTLSGRHLKRASLDAPFEFID